MNDKLDITNKNHKGQLHGYQEWYSGNGNGTLLLRGYLKHNESIGYEEWCSYKKTNFYIR